MKILGTLISAVVALALLWPRCARSWGVGEHRCRRPRGHAGGCYCCEWGELERIAETTAGMRVLARRAVYCPRGVN